MARPGEPLTPSAWHAMERAADRLKRPALMKGRTKSRPVVSRFTVVAENTNTVTCAWPATSNEIAIAKRYGTRGSITGGYQPGAELYAAIHILGGTGVPQTEWMEITSGGIAGEQRPRPKIINIEYQQTAGHGIQPPYLGWRGCRFSAIDIEQFSRISERRWFARGENRYWRENNDPFPTQASFDDPICVGGISTTDDNPHEINPVRYLPTWDATPTIEPGPGWFREHIFMTGTLCVPWFRLKFIPADGSSEVILYDPPMYPDVNTLASGGPNQCGVVVNYTNSTGGGLEYWVTDVSALFWLRNAWRLVSIIEFDDPLQIGDYEFTWRVSPWDTTGNRAYDITGGEVGHVNVFIRDGAQIASGFEMGATDFAVTWPGSEFVTRTVTLL